MNIDTLRYKKPQISDLYLSIYRPKILTTARINATASRNSRVISISPVVSPPDVSNRRMIVGSVAGGNDLGTVRVRNMTSNEITVAENGDVVWTSGSYCTIYDYVDIGPVRPRIIQNPNDLEKVIFYKDHDIEYTNQNSILGAFPCAGHHRAANIDPNLGYVDLYWTATGTYHVAGSSMTYLWEFEGGTPSTSSAQNPGLIRYSTPGFYVTKLTVTGANGSVDVTYRYISIHNTSDNPAIPKWKFSGLRGSRASGGWTIDIEISMWDLPYQPMSGDLVIIYSDDYYRQEKAFIEFGNTQPPDGIKFVGYVLKDSIRYNYQSRTYSFTAGTVNEAMKASENFVISVESVQTPSNWTELADMNGSKALYHYLRWHSTVLNVTDFRYLGNDFRVQFFDTEKTNLYDALNNFFSRAYLGQIVSNKKSMLYAETLPEASVIPTSMRNPHFSIERPDWIGSPSIERRLYNATAFIDVGAIKFDGPSVTDSVPLLSGAPSASPSSYGKLTAQTGLVAQGQEQLNQLSGNLYAKQNSSIVAATFQFNGYSALDIAPISYVLVSAPKEDTGLFLSISGTFMVEDIDREFQSQTFMDSLRLSPVVDGIPGETLEVPISPSDGFNPSPITPPPPIIPPFPFPSGDNILILLHVSEYGLWWTEDYQEESVRWWSMNSGLSGSQLTYKSVEIGSDGFVWALNDFDLFGGYLKTNLSPLVNFGYFTGTYGERTTFFGGLPNPFNPNQYVLYVGDNFPPYPARIYLVDRISKSITEKAAIQAPVFSSDASISYGNQKFTTTKVFGTLGQVNGVVINKDLSAISVTTNTIRQNSDRFWYRRAGETDLIYTGAERSPAASNPSSGTWSQFSHSGTTLELYQGIHSSPDGQYFMGFIGDGDFGLLDTSARLLRSSDAGTIWGNVPAFSGTFVDAIPNGPVQNVGDRDRWVISTRGDVGIEVPGYVLITEDFGESWYDITGNLRDFVGEYFIPKRIRIFKT